jgi:putative CocE/NonD family hydrolase
MPRLERLPGLPVTVEREVSCRMRDGVTLRADVYRPEEGGPHPVLLVRTPYGKAAAQSDVGYAHPSWYARHGYVVVSQDTRGRGASDGVFSPFRDEADDGYDTVEWAAKLPAADGRVAMYGFSYPGTAQLLAATRRPPSLATICPAFTAPGVEDWVYYGGAFSLAFASTWALALALDDARRCGDESAVATLDAAALDVRTSYWTLPLRAHAALAAHAPYYLDWLDHPIGHEYWTLRSATAGLEQIAVPALHVGGWWDIFVAGTVSSFNGVRAARSAAQKLVVGPWPHNVWQPLGTDDPAAGPRAVDDWQLRWLDHVLKGRETGVLAAPVTVHVAGDGWRDLDGWPPSGTQTVDWFVHSNGRANSVTGDGTLSTEAPGNEPPDVFVYDPAYPVASVGGHSCCDPGVAPVGPAPQLELESQKTVLVYTSAPLEGELELLGDVTVILHAATSAADTDFTARLCTVDPDGRSTNVQEGIIRARYRDPFGSPSPLVSGRVYEFRIGLGPVALRVPAGHRLRLDVSSSDFPMWDRNLNTGGALGHEALSSAVVATQVVLHDRSHPSRVSLPVSR